MRIRRARTVSLLTIATFFTSSLLTSTSFFFVSLRGRYEPKRHRFFAGLRSFASLLVCLPAARPPALPSVASFFWFGRGVFVASPPAGFAGGFFGLAPRAGWLRRPRRASSLPLPLSPSASGLGRSRVPAPSTRRSSSLLGLPCGGQTHAATTKFSLSIRRKQVSA